MTESVTFTLSADHRRCDDMLSAAENYVHRGDWKSADDNLQAFRNATLRHFEVEERILFPELETRAGGALGPTQIMRLEHEQVRSLLEDLNKDVEARDRDRYLGSSETLLTLLQQHNIKEEQILYPMADLELADGISELLHRIRDAFAV